LGIGLWKNLSSNSSRSSDLLREVGEVSGTIKVDEQRVARCAADAAKGAECIGQWLIPEEHSCRLARMLSKNEYRPSGRSREVSTFYQNQKFDGQRSSSAHPRSGRKR
jgi:hypothetical protein